ncbi:cellulase family glycosylhydrolase [Pseudobutyrivibrio sp. MD2005]|uniref:cellulase family glycosylhydrolase n=1 Tax=Pseudobutyrivibrio sp. MD2005 TaxID=1410616 RepID=UPI000486E760|nr:cellulase family glycosylhydrolase [Pseudobutyrivibrio sp. MD2005]
MNKRKRLCALFLVFSFILFLIINSPVYADENSYVHARPSTNGQLHVEGTQLVDKNGRPVQLKGVSTHGLTWFPDIIDSNIFNQLSNEWDCNLIRLPMYSVIYCENPEESLELMKKGVEYAIASDMYVIVDWHVLEDKDPNIHKDEAIAFFDAFTKEYADVPNIIYEICNEPNGQTFWNDIYEYANEVIPVIRNNSQDSVILVGTPYFDAYLEASIRKPLEFDDLMYVLHFYAGTHYDDIQAEVTEAMERGLPVFVSECGITLASGDEGYDFDNAVSWFNMLDDYGISYAVWSLSNKNELSAMLKPEYKPGEPITDKDLTPCGLWVRDLVKGIAPADIKVPEISNKKSLMPLWLKESLNDRDIVIFHRWPIIALKVFVTLIVLLMLVFLIRKITTKKGTNYGSLYENAIKETFKEKLIDKLRFTVLVLTVFFALMYLYWRIVYSIPFKAGWVAVFFNILLLCVEVFGFFESISLYLNLMAKKDFPLPEIEEDEYPDVDIFIATYNELNDLLRRTINGCKHLQYPDKSKIHIWVCDDNRRSQVRALAESMGVGYFDRPDNEGAKAGNLNHAMGLTTSPYVVTLDADMIVKSDFLMKTIPYFIDAKKKGLSLGFVQTPQCFYEPDVFQHALYSEKNAPNEQDFFYRTIEVAKTSTNSVIYGGSNTVIARQAIEDIGGFYTESITEDFATGVLIESSGYVSLAIPEPLASGKTPDIFRDHITQRIRWGRGVISTAKQLHLFTRKGLSFAQKFSYWSSVVYWYSSIKSLIYFISPLLFAIFAIPVFICTWVDLLLFWFPMYVMQDICLRFYSRNTVSLKWSGIYETCVMPHLIIPVIKELFGITTKKFEVTDKAKKTVVRQPDIRGMSPYLIMLGLSIIGIARICTCVDGLQSLGLVVLVFWIVRNMYYLIMALFLVDGRESDTENVRVADAEFVVLKRSDGSEFEGITTYMTEHSINIYIDDKTDIKIGDRIQIQIETHSAKVDMDGVIIAVIPSKRRNVVVYSMEILDYRDSEYEYFQVLYDRVPTLPQSLTKDFGMFTHLFRNIAHRILR